MILKDLLDVLIECYIDVWAFLTKEKDENQALIYSDLERNETEDTYSALLWNFGNSEVKEITAGTTNNLIITIDEIVEKDE